MDIFFLLILLAILVLPTFLMSRRQRAKMAEIHKIQDELVPGDRVVTTSGQHATVVSVNTETIVLELSPGMYSTFEKIAVVRVLAKADQPLPYLEAEPSPELGTENYGESHSPEPDTDQGRADGPESHPENRPDNR